MSTVAYVAAAVGLLGLLVALWVVAGIRLDVVRRRDEEARW